MKHAIPRSETSRLNETIEHAMTLAEAGEPLRGCQVIEGAIQRLHDRPEPWIPELLKEYEAVLDEYRKTHGKSLAG